MTDRTPTGNPDSLKRTRNDRAPPESSNLRETGRHVPKHFDGTERQPELEPPVELPPGKRGLSRNKAKPGMPGGNRN